MRNHRSNTPRVVEDGDYLLVHNPFNTSFGQRVRRLGADWDAKEKAWLVDKNQETNLRKLLVDVYGTDGEDEVELVTVHLDVDVEGERNVMCFGRVLASARTSDSVPWLGAGVKNVDGDLTADGTKDKPVVIAVGGFTMFDVPVTMLKHVPEGVTIRQVERETDAELELLLNRKAALEDRLADVEEQIAMFEQMEHEPLVFAQSEEPSPFGEDVVSKPVAPF